MSNEKVDTEKLFKAIAKSKEAGLETKVSILTKVHNEQLDNLVRAEVDVDYTQYLMLLEPSVPDHSQRNNDLKDMVKKKGKLVEIIRRHMMAELTESGGEKNEQKN